MFILIEDLKQEPLHIHHAFPAGEINFLHEDAKLIEPVVADFVLTPNDFELHVAGTVETTVNFKCSRCAKEFSRPAAARFDLSYLPQPKWTNENAEIELKYEDMEVSYYDGVSFDVNLMVLEQIEFSMPMRFVCQEECKGLCYKCGADLNEGKCHCPDEEKDSRFSVLLEFKKKADK